MSEMFDFEDGRGPVPAHQHANGGGWVADTVIIPAEIYIGRTARISGGEIYGGARIYGGVISGGVIKATPIQIQGTRDFLISLPNNIIVVGCERHTIKEWLEKGPEIGAAHSYSEAQIVEYMAYIRLIADHVKRRSEIPEGGE